MHFIPLHNIIVVLLLFSCRHFEVISMIFAYHCLALTSRHPITSPAHSWLQKETCTMSNTLQLNGMKTNVACFKRCVMWTECYILRSICRHINCTAAHFYTIIIHKLTVCCGLPTLLAIHNSLNHELFLVFACTLMLFKHAVPCDSSLLGLSTLCFYYSFQ